MPAKKILLTGATGAIGFEILNQLKTENALSGITVLARNTKKNHRKLQPFKGQISIIYGDVTDANAVLKAVKDQDIIIHLAAIIPTVEDLDHEYVNQINIGGTRNIVEAMKSTAPGAFLLYSSSVATYGDRLKNPIISVSDPLLGAEHDNYSRSKVEAEKIIQASGLHWSIFRLSAIMGIGNHRISEKMFEMPLETVMEIATVKDTARAFVRATDHQNELDQKIFNLSGGEYCRVNYGAFLTNAFNLFGLGQLNFPKHAFAFQNFHCGIYCDADDLEQILHFRKDTIESYFEEFKSSIPSWQSTITKPFAPLVKRYLLTLSKPYKAYKKGDRDRIHFYFGKL